MAISRHEYAFNEVLLLVLYFRWTPPVIGTIGDKRDYIRVLLYSYYTTSTGGGGPPKLYCFRSLIKLFKPLPCSIRHLVFLRDDQTC